MTGRFDVFALFPTPIVHFEVPDSAALNWYYLSNLTGTGPGDAWMLGAPPTGGYRFVTLHWNGSDFDDLRVPPEVELGSIGGDAPDDVWAAVRPPLVPRLFHFDGHEWLETPTVGLPIADLMGIPGVATIAISDRGGLFVRSRQR